MRFPIDTSTLAFVVAIPPAPVIDFKSKDQRFVEVDGKRVPLLAIHLLVMDGTDSFLIKFSLLEDPGVAQGQLVRVRGLAHQLAKGGEMKWWSAEGVEPLGPPLHAAPTAVAAAGPPAVNDPPPPRRGRSPLESGTPGGEG